MSGSLRDRITVIGGTPKPGDTHVAAYVPIDLLDAAVPATDDRDAYERGRADERAHIRSGADNRFAGWYVVRADLLDGQP